MTVSVILKNRQLLFFSKGYVKVRVLHIKATELSFVYSCDFGQTFGPAHLAEVLAKQMGNVGTKQKPLALL